MKTPELISLISLVLVVYLSAESDRRTLKRGQPVDHDLSFLRLALVGATIYVFAGLLPYIIPVIDLTWRQLIILPALMVLLAWTLKDTLMAFILKRPLWFLGHTAELDRWQIETFCRLGSDYLELIRKGKDTGLVGELVMKDLRVVWAVKVLLVVGLVLVY